MKKVYCQILLDSSIDTFLHKRNCVQQSCLHIFKFKTFPLFIIGLHKYVIPIHINALGKLTKIHEHQREKYKRLDNLPFRG